MRFNIGKSADLFFWRNNSGNEIDVIVETPNGLFPIEIKSGQTITADYFKGLNFWNKINGKTEGAVIYAGTEHQKRSNGIEVIPWNKIKEIGF